MDSKYRSPLCATCKTMFAEIASVLKQHSEGTHCLNQPRAEHSAEQQNSKPLRNEGWHHKTTKTLLLSAAQGCGFCSQLKERMYRIRVRHRYSEAPGDRLWLRYVLEHYSTGMFIIFLYAEPNDRPLERFSNTTWDPKWITDEHTLRHLLCDATGDREVIEKAHSWLSDCIAHHDCSRMLVEQNFYPPRLLKLDKETVQLIDSEQNALSGSYATLSYCWGPNPQHLTLTTQSMAVFREGIQQDRLARTFRDAIQVSQSLGVQYLWIDALCILQSGEGSHDDWQKHVSEMGTIYQNGLFNIAADHGKNADAGCFVSRDPDTIKPCILDASPITDRNALTPLGQDRQSVENQHQLISSRFLEDVLWDTTLSTRAWVHQERLLSPRILHFGRQQLAWECHEMMACETTLFGSKSDLETRDLIAPFSFREASFHRWNNIVRAYSRACLTRPSDKLPAIGGIAKRISLERNAKYVAGIFWQDLPEALQWRYAGGPRGGIVTPYRAPSWSWASREGEVFFYETRDDIQSGDLASVDDVCLEYADESNPFGQVNNGFMTITGPVIRIASLNVDSLTKYSFTSCEVAEHPLLSPLRGYFNLDEVTLDRLQHETSILFLTYTASFLIGLVITPATKSAQTHRWIRIGLCHIEFEDARYPGWMSDAIRYLKTTQKTTIELE